MPDLRERVEPAALAAIRDVLPTVEAEPARYRQLTFELDLERGAVTGAHCWLDRAVDLRKLLGPTR